MDSGFVFLVFGGFLAFMVLVAVLGYRAAKKRREGFAALAAARGWSYAERDDRWCDTFQGSPFGNGHNRQAANILTGQYDGRSFVAFDYVYYTTETSTDSQGHSHTHEESHR